MTVDFPSETMEARRKWYNTFQVLKEKINTEKISFRNEEEITIFSNDGKVKEYVTSRPTLKNG